MRPGAGHVEYKTRAYRLALGGEDNHVWVSVKDNVGVSGLNSLWVLDMGGPSAKKASRYCWRGCYCRAKTTMNGVFCDSRSSFSRR